MQCTGWSVYILLAWAVNKLNGNDFTINLGANLLAIFILGILNTHAFRFLIIQYNWFALKLPRLVTQVIFAALVFGMAFHLQQWVFSELLIARQPLQFNFIDVFQKVVNWSGICMLWSLFYFIAHFIENYKKEEINNLQWEALKSETELNKLKSQLNPHFIFNTMNSIRALVEEDKEKAKVAITQLSTILRSTLLMSRQKLIPFSEEWKLVCDYLALEKIRLEERLEVETAIPEEAGTFDIPPMMLQTLVENAIKHGISRLPNGGKLHIQAQVQQHVLEISITNSGQLSTDKPETGFGIKNTLQRLQILYGNKAHFSIAENNNQTVTAHITIPKLLST